MAARDLDLTKTVGPFIHKGTLAVVLIRRLDCRLWVDFQGLGMRHVYPEDVRAY
jgi:hypothetical protein